MSDHWNSIANLLGTPSLSPVQKKSDSAKPAKRAEAVEPVAADVAPVEEDVPAAKPKAEGSRLRSSWDAVARLFGVASPEAAPETASSQDSKRASDATAGRSHADVPDIAKAAPVGKKNKPSMWGEPAAAESVAEPAPVEKIEEERRPSPRRTESAFRPEVSDESEEPPRRGRGERNERGRGRSRGGRGAEARTSETDAVADEPVRSVEPVRERDFEPSAEIENAERRSHRRPPRRARAESEFDTPAEVDRDLPVADRGPRAADGETRGDRGDRHAERGSERNAGRRAPRDAGSDRPASDRSASERSERSERGSGERSQERGQRPPRGGGRGESRHESPRGEREPRGESDSRSRGGDRSEAASSRSHRDHDRIDRDANRQIRKPAAAQGFGAGIVDDIDDDLDVSPVRDEFSDAGEPVSEESREGRPDGERSSRRRRGRGRRGDKRADKPAAASAVDRDAVDDEDDSEEIIARNSKIPSWADTIGTIVANNMENHSRTQATHGRGPRGGGRGGRR